MKLVGLAALLEGKALTELIIDWPFLPEESGSGTGIKGGREELRFLSWSVPSGLRRTADSFHNADWASASPQPERDAEHVSFSNTSKYKQWLKPYKTRANPHNLN